MAADRESLLEAEHELQRAQLASDTNALERLLHNHLRFVGPHGTVFDKATDLSAHEAGLIEFKASSPIVIEAHVFGTTGISLALIEMEVVFNGELVISTTRFTRTWLYEDDRWQIVGGAIVDVPGQ
jgi:hypothetical protein